MTLSKSSRRLVAGVTALLLVACQSLAVARAGGLGSAESGAGAAMISCHNPGEGPGNTEDTARQASCQSKYTSPSPPGFTILDLTDLPAFTVSVVRLPVVPAFLQAAASQLERIEPPPLLILHCCLRN